MGQIRVLPSNRQITLNELETLKETIKRQREKEKAAHASA